MKLFLMNLSKLQLFSGCSHHQKLHHKTFSETCYFHEFVNLRMLRITKTRFVSVIVMLKRFKIIKKVSKVQPLLKNGVVLFREVMFKKHNFKKRMYQMICGRIRWITFTEPIYDMLRFIDPMSRIFTYSLNVGYND